MNTVRPTLEVKYFHPSPINKKHVLAFRALSWLITGYGGKEVPPFSRSFMGGEQDIRGFEIWGITPDRVHRVERVGGTCLNSDGSAAYAEDGERRSADGHPGDDADSDLSADHAGRGFPGGHQL